MGTGAITQYVDVAQLVLYAFWIFFAGLIYYLVRENHREGYPMETESGRGNVTGWPIPQPKTFKLAHGGEVTVPNLAASTQRLAAEPAHRWAGSPLVPTGDPMLAGVGPGSWANRADTPDLNYEGTPKIVPLRLVAHSSVNRGDIDPRGLPVVGADGVVAGRVADLWLDTSEQIFRYFELELAGSGRHVLVPMAFARVRRHEVRVEAVLGSQFAAVPALHQPEVITLLEEEKIVAYFGGGTLYAHPSRLEPLL
jgi:photosynthetic reaction center H subunit